VDLEEKVETEMMEYSGLIPMETMDHEGRMEDEDRVEAEVQMGQMVYSILSPWFNRWLYLWFELSLAISRIKMTIPQLVCG
jgi:hypothetical protein